MEALLHLFPPAGYLEKVTLGYTEGSKETLSGSPPPLYPSN